MCAMVLHFRLWCRTPPLNLAAPSSCPILKPPVTSAALALEYKARIVAAVPKGIDFEPLMTLYLTDNLPPEEIVKAKAAGVVACKLYPAGATTNSDAGVTDLKKIYPTLAAMQKVGMLLLVHGEVTSSDIDLFDREAVFIETQLIPLRRDFQNSKLCLSTSPPKMPQTM
jgi:dihydroorotase